MMITRMLDWWDRTERKWRRSFGDDISTPRGRFWSKVHFQLFDHAFLRSFWHNFEEIGPGIYRSNQPTHRRFRKYRDMGVKTVVNLRGPDSRAQYLFEVESCEQLGLTLIDAKLWARHAPTREAVIDVIDVLRSAERPLLFHCKSGADRTGFVGVLYKLIFEGTTIAEARKQLSLRYIHLDFTATGVQDYIIDVFEARQTLGTIGFEDWIRTEYTHAPLKDGFRSKRPALDVAKELAA